MEREQEDVFQFASSRKKRGQQLALEQGFDPDQLNLTYLVLENGQCYTKSEASFRLLGKLRAEVPFIRF